MCLMGMGVSIINFEFNCDSAGVIYLISCKRCKMNYVGSIITAFRIRFNNHKSSFKKYGEGQKGMPGEQLYAHFFEKEHRGLEDIKVMIIDKTNVNQPMEREGFWVYCLSTFIPNGLNVRDFI